MNRKLLDSPSLRHRYYLAGALLFAGFVIFQFFGNATRGYIDTSSMFYWLGFLWFNEGTEAEHGPIILGLSVWILWRNLQHSPDRSLQPRLMVGLAWIGVAVVLHVVGYLVQQTRVSIVAALLYLVGVAYLAGGEKWGRAALFPASFMLFSIPMTFLTDILGHHMRMGVTGVTFTLSQWCGIDVVRLGTQLFAPDRTFQYDVAPACSGIRSLIAITAISALVGYLSFRSWWRLGLLLALSLPYAFVGNVIRIFSIVLAGEWLGQEAGTFVHEWFGFVTFLIVLGLALGTVRLMEVLIPEKMTDDERGEEDTEKTGQVSVSATEDIVIGRSAWIAVVPVVVAIGAGIFAIATIEKLKEGDQCGVYLSPNANDPIALPKMLDIEWLGSDIEVSRAERDILPPDTGFSRKIYRNILGRDVLVSIVLSGRDRTSIHKPEICLEAQGWSIKNRGKYRFAVPTLESDVLETTLLKTEFKVKNEKNGEFVVPGLFAYWFVGGDTVVATHWERMMKMAVDRLFGFKSHRWAYVFAQTNVLDSEEDGLKRLEEVIALSVPTFQRVGVVK